MARARRSGPLFIMLAGLLSVTVGTTHAAPLRVPEATFAIPTSNVASAGPVLDARSIVYAVATPRYHRPVCVSCGQKPFTGFRMQVYIRTYARHGRAMTVTAPRLLFTGPEGAQMHLDALRSGRLVYDTSTAAGAWQLFVRNISTGQVALLDSSRTEGQGSRLVRAGSDGHVVAWQSSTQAYVSPRPVIWRVNLVTGHRDLLPCRAVTASAYCVFSQIEGKRLVLVREGRYRPSSQILVQNLVTNRVRALTPAGGANWEPFLSGRVLVWVHGQLTLGHRHSLVVQNLSTGRRVALPESSTQLPRIAVGRYVVFSRDDRPEGAVQVYDTQTFSRRTSVRGPDGARFLPGGMVQVGGSAALVPEHVPCGDPFGICPARLVLMGLGPTG